MERERETANLLLLLLVADDAITASAAVCAGPHAT